MTNFVIVGTQRSGTTYIRHCLNSHDDICCHGEVFQKRYKGENGYYRCLENSLPRRLLHYIYRSAVVQHYLDELYGDETVGHIGMKLMHSQIRYLPYEFPMVIPYIKKNGIKVLHVVRRNVLKTHISRVTAMKRQMYHAKTSQDIVKINIETGSLVAQLNKIDYENKAWQKIFSSDNYMCLDYEDFVDNKEEKTREMLGFLNVDKYQELHSSNVKINPDDMRGLIINYDEMKDVLQGTNFEYCLDAGEKSA